MPLVVLALLIVVVTDTMLQVNEFIFGVSVLTITLLTFAISALALCFGTIFPQFETENAAQIPTSFGGLVFMMVSVLLLLAVIGCEARPVYNYLSRQENTRDLVIGFGLAGALCLGSTLLPLRIARRRLAAIERG